MEKVAMAALLEGRLVRACGPDTGVVGAADVDALSGTDSTSISSSISRFSSPQLLSFDQCSLARSLSSEEERR